MCVCVCVEQAIRDGVIEATIDHEQGFMQSKVRDRGREREGGERERDRGRETERGRQREGGERERAILQENTDIYSTKEPQEAFHQRIKFCLELYNTSIRVSVPFPYSHVSIL